MGYWTPLTFSQEGSHLGGKNAIPPPSFILLQGDCPLGIVDGWGTSHPPILVLSSSCFWK